MSSNILSILGARVRVLLQKYYVSLLQADEWYIENKDPFYHMACMITRFFSDIRPEDETCTFDETLGFVFDDAWSRRIGIRAELEHEQDIYQKLVDSVREFLRQARLWRYAIQHHMDDFSVFTTVYYTLQLERYIVSRKIEVDLRIDVPDDVTVFADMRV